MVNNSIGLLLVLLWCLCPIEVLASTIQVSDSAQVIFEATFDNTLATTENEEPVAAAGLTFENGVSGEGVLIDAGDILQYPVQGNLKASEGSMSLWVRPTWDPGGVLYRILVLKWQQFGNFELHVDEEKQLAFAVNTAQVEGKPIKIAFASADNWKANTWYFLTFTWSSDNIVIYVNGRKAAETEVGFDIPSTTDDSFHLGSFEGEEAFNGVMDELRVYDAPLTPAMVQSQYEEYLGQSQHNAVSIVDIFDRNVTSGITLVDWEGPVRNPALKYYLKGNDTVEYPLTVNLLADEERAFFSLPSTISKDGPTKSMVLTSSDDLTSFLFSVYMDENYEDETFDLVLQYSVDGIPARQIIPVTVIDQDIDRPLTYPVIVDFSEARDPLMLDPNTQAVITQAAEDWLYYVDGEGIDSIEVGESWLDIGGQDHLFDAKRVTNPVAYKGYYLYAYGNTNQGPCVCSTGSPNRELLQTSGGEEVPIFRIGALHLNLFGQAFNTPPTGWEVLGPYDNWTQEGYVGTDMYSLAKHEIGHAMVFENSPLFLLAQGRDPTNPYPDETVIPTPNGFTSPALTAYYPDEVVPLFPESLSHVIRVLDPASQVPPYGGGVDDEVMPGGREMLTKLDILIMESVGYPLRDNGVTRPLALTADGTFNGDVNTDFEVSLVGQGGIPIYYYDISNGALPNGLELDSRTGILSGTPEEAGLFAVSFSVKDYDERSLGATLEVTLNIGGGATEVEDILEVPTDFALQQNYPNPFHPTTQIEYQLPLVSKIQIVVFNILGQKVRTLVDEDQSAGFHSIEWDGRSDSGIQVSSGVYLYQIRATVSGAQKYLATKKLLLL